jgi:hypothetical protein
MMRRRRDANCQYPFAADGILGGSSEVAEAGPCPLRRAVWAVTGSANGVA